MYQQQSPEVHRHCVPLLRSTYEEVLKSDSAELPSYTCNNYNYPRYQAPLPIPSGNQTFNELKSPTMSDCNLLQQMWHNQFYSIHRNPMQYPSTAYNQCSSNYQFPSYVPDPNIPYDIHSDNTQLWQQVKSLSCLDSQPNYSQFTMRDYDAMLNVQYPKAGENGNKEQECVKCGMVTGGSFRRDSNGHFLCYNCSHGGAFTPTPIDIMIPVHKRTNCTKTLSRKQTSKRTGLLCSNCKSDHTTLWRRNAEGQPVCNACGLYYRLHKSARPESMKKETLQTRKRKTKRKPAICMKYLQSAEYPLKTDAQMDHQMLTSTFPNTSWM